MKGLKTYKVRGAGDFPLDCLRYDSAYPDTQEDARVAQYEDSLRTVTLVSLNDPTPDRWQSFGWQVVG